MVGSPTQAHRRKRVENAQVGKTCHKTTCFTMGPKMITHTFLLFGNSFPNCTGHLLHKAFWQELFCVIRRLHKVLSVNAPITHINCLGINFPITCTSITQKNHFRIICVIISGLIVVAISECETVLSEGNLAINLWGWQIAGDCGVAALVMFFIRSLWNQGLVHTRVLA